MLTRLGPEELHRGEGQGEPGGYAHPSYVQTLAEFGAPIHLPSADAWLLRRPIPGCADVDAIGAYPFFACADYARLREDLSGSTDLVSVGVVPDPFSFGDVALLRAAFHHVVPFKTQYLADLETGFDRYLSRHHRRDARRGLANFAIECASEPAVHAGEWADLYQDLVVRRALSGLRAFSRASLAGQLAVPGCRYFRALRDGTVHGVAVCYIDRGVAYLHLTSSTVLGRKLSAQYALIWSAIEHCRSVARWFVLGSVPGLSEEENTGLSFFKAGWATATCQGYFCGHVTNAHRYEALCARRGGTGPAFPAYRADPLA